MPPPEMVALVAGFIKPEEFFRYGKYAATWIAEMLARNGVTPRGLGTVLDFGCGCGRVIRHWPALTDAQLHGSDYNPISSSGARENLTFGDFRTNELEPPLPFDDDTFDFVYALSIFTHLDADLQMPWIEELTRVTKPGGVMLPTFHGRSRVEYMREHGEYERIAPQFDAGELVVIEGGELGRQRVLGLPPGEVGPRRAGRAGSSCSTSHLRARSTSSRTPCCSASRLSPPYASAHSSSTRSRMSRNAARSMLRSCARAVSRALRSRSSIDTRSATARARRRPRSRPPQ